MTTLAKPALALLFLLVPELTWAQATVEYGIGLGGAVDRADQSGKVVKKGTKKTADAVGAKIESVGELSFPLDASDGPAPTAPVSREPLPPRR